MKNATFLLRTKGHRYLLRITRPGYKDPDVVQSELVWLDAIAKDTDISVPKPVANKKGDLFTVTSIDGVPEPRICVLFGWVKGRFCRQADLTEPHLEKVGRLMGRLHCHAEEFVPPSDFTRIRWDYEGLLGGGTGGNLKLARALLDHERQEILDQATNITRSTIEQLGETSSVFGLIHADLHQDNYVFLKGEARAIDFDDCGWGHYLLDIGASLGPLVSQSHFFSLRAAFLHGYRSVRNLSSECENLLTSFLIADRLKIAIWMAGRLDNPGLRDGAMKFVEDRVDQIKNMMKWPPQKTSL